MKFLNLNLQLLKNINTHGTGCVFSTSLCVYLAKGFSEEISIKKSKKFLIERFEKLPNLRYILWTNNLKFIINKFFHQIF